MSTKSHGGGPAFPLENPRHLENGELFRQFTGMTLRQWYAGQALGEITGDQGWAVPAGVTWPEFAAAKAFAIADAMIAFEAQEGDAS